MTTKFTSLMRSLHRDIGYFLVGIILVFAVSGIAVNHKDDWNPDFVIHRSDVELPLPQDKSQISKDLIENLLSEIPGVGEFRAFDFPSETRIKIFLSDGSIVSHLGDSTGEYETIRKRPFFSQINALHLNPKSWWLIYSDFSAVCLIFLAISGLVVPQGKKGLKQRGKWYLVAGVIIPFLAMIL